MENQELVKVIPLGGMGEIGKNMYVVEFHDEIVIVDSGVKFAGDQLLGIDLIIPDFSYLVEHSDKIKGLFITHGHEDHIGGIPYLLKKLKIPVYAGGLAIGFIKSKLEEHNLLGQAELHEISDDTKVRFTNLTVSFFRTTHSIPDSFGILIQTPLGNVVHTGDFKFDLSPTGTHSDITKMSQIGKDGVLCLLSDSTNSEVPGFSVSEQYISKNIHHVFSKQKGRIIIALFASNVHRLQEVIKASVANGRKVVVFGRSMERAITIGKELGYIEAPDGTFISADELNSYKKRELTIICTGSQGEPFAALSRISDDKHRYIHVEKGDTFIFSSSPIPGNILSVNKVINKLMKAGAEIIDHNDEDIHTSGHGGQEELKLMIHLMKPKFLVPIHGEYRMQKMHQALAVDCKIPLENTFILDNGDILSMSATNAELTGKVPSGSVYVSGTRINNDGEDALRERKSLSESGILSIFILRDEKTLLDKPQIISRGFVYMKDSEFLIGELQSLSTTLFHEYANDSNIEEIMMKSIEEYIYKRLKRRPIVLIKIIDIHKNVELV